jgi:sirohydrochlorin cobaltochelatase
VLSRRYYPGMTPTRHAIVLFAHGARDPAWARPMEGIAAQLRGLRPGVEVSVAFLELLTPDLASELERLAASGVGSIDIAPIFWAAGGHIRKDLPDLLAGFAARHPQVRTRVLPVLSDLPGMTGFVAQALLDSSQAG